MMERLMMTRCINIAAALLCGALSASLSASTVIKGTVTTTDVIWDGALERSGFILPLGYEPVPQVVNSEHWTPGLSAMNTALTLTSDGGDSVTLDLNAIGLEYDYTGNSATVEPNPLPATFCQNTYRQGTHLLIESDGSAPCFSSERVRYAQAMQPFYYVRPAIKIADSALLQAFNGQPSGLYRGVFPLQYRYAYKEPSGVTTYRNLSTHLVLSLLHRPNDITNVVVSPPVLDLTPNYDRVDQEIDAQGRTSILVEGELQSGLRLYLQDIDYVLKNQASTLPIGIECTTCSPTALVRDGQRLTPSVSIPSSGQMATIDLDIGYQGIAFSDVIDGTYSNHFTFIIEAAF